MPYQTVKITLVAKDTCDVLFTIDELTEHVRKLFKDTEYFEVLSVTIEIEKATDGKS